MEAAAEATTTSSREGKASRRNRRRSEKKSLCRIEQEKVEELEVTYEEQADQEDWLHFRRYFENYLARHYGSCQDINPLWVRCSLRRDLYRDMLPPIMPCRSIQSEWHKQKMVLSGPYMCMAGLDSVDAKRNFLFNRTRENCQVLTQNDSDLLLTGPSRAVVLVGYVWFQVELKLKGEKESEDKLLCLKVFDHHMPPCYRGKPHMIRTCFSSKHGITEVKYAPIRETVEATVASVRLIDRVSWINNLRGRVVCRANNAEGEIVLLDSRDGRMPISSDGVIELSRRVVSVEVRRQLDVNVVTSLVHDKSQVVSAGRVVFTSKNAGYSRGTCDLGFCTVEITVAWSVIAIPGLKDSNWPVR
ncbi:hypothetical protein ACP70R_014413 [Stipagrostis hirtigluma subsp. patula]